MAAKGVIAGLVASWVKALPSRAYGHAGRPGVVSPPSASWASPPTLRRASAAPTSCANSPAAGTWRSRRAPSRASHPSGTTAAGQLPLRDRSRPTSPAHRARCAGGVPPTTTSGRPAHAPDLAQEWGAAAGTGQPPSMSILGGIGGHTVLTLALVAVI